MHFYTCKVSVKIHCGSKSVLEPSIGFQNDSRPFLTHNDPQQEHSSNRRHCVYISSCHCLVPATLIFAYGSCCLRYFYIRIKSNWHGVFLYPQQVKNRRMYRRMYVFDRTISVKFVELLINAFGPQNFMWIL